MNCPNCNAEIDDGQFDGFPLGSVVTCAACGCIAQVDGDYCDGGDWGFWLVETPEWIEAQRKKETL